MVSIRFEFVDACDFSLADDERCWSLRFQDFFDRDLSDIRETSLTPLAAFYRLHWAYLGPDSHGIGVRWHISQEDPQ